MKEEKKPLNIKLIVKQQLNTRKKLIFVSILAVVLLLFAYTFIEPYWIDIKTTPIKSRDIPENFNDTKIIFVSDIHHGPYFSKDRVRKLVERINELNPDIILLGGDYVHRDPRYITPCFKELSKLKAKINVFGVLGNHDHWENAELTRHEMKNAGIKEIDNKAEWLYKDGDRFKIGGVGDLMEGAQDINPTIKDTEKNDFVILLSHNPDYFEKLETDKVDLMLSGHTHGGQVTLFGLWAPLIPSTYGQKYRTGLVETVQTKILISNGIGTITPPVRFFARPQINVVNLRG